MPGRLVRLVLLMCLVVPLSAVSGQDTARPELRTRPPQPRLPPPGGPDGQITLDVQVTDKSGTPIRGLRKEDFTLLDDNRPANVRSFRAVDSALAATTDLPVEIILLIDAVNTSPEVVGSEEGEINKFLLQNGGKLVQPVSLIIFSGGGTKIIRNGSTRDGKALATLFNQYETKLRSITPSRGFYEAVERLDLSIKTLTSIAEDEQTRPGRKLMIWFSHGWPMLSVPNADLSRRNKRWLFNAIVAASTGLRQARITLYSIEQLGGARVSSYENFLKGITSSDGALPGNLGLQVLAVQSGGRVFNESNDLAAAITNCAADADAFYVLSFDSAQADRLDEYHSLGVTVDRSGITARTRTGYYAQP